MRKIGDKLYYDVPEWQPFDEGLLAEAGVPEEAVRALAGTGLPDNAYEMFVRNPERELTATQLPDCGEALYLGCYCDDWTTYWLRTADGSVWMRWGFLNQPADRVARINTSCAGLQGIVRAICDVKSSGVDESDAPAYEALACETIIRAVASDPQIFEGDASWWSSCFEEFQYGLPRLVAGDRMLYELVRRDESGSWVLDHPGFEPDEED